MKKTFKILIITMLTILLSACSDKMEAESLWTADELAQFETRIEVPNGSHVECCTALRDWIGYQVMPDIIPETGAYPSILIQEFSLYSVEEGFPLTAEEKFQEILKTIDLNADYYEPIQEPSTFQGYGGEMAAFNRLDKAGLDFVFTHEDLVFIVAFSEPDMWKELGLMPEDFLAKISFKAEASQSLPASQ